MTRPEPALEPVPIIHSFVIQRGQLGVGRLLHQGCLCPIGFLCRSLGVPDSDLEGKSWVPEGWSQVPPGFVGIGSKRYGNAATRVVAIADESDARTPQWEQRIADAFSESGITVTFQGSYA